MKNKLTSAQTRALGKLDNGKFIYPRNIGEKKSTLDALVKLGMVEELTIKDTHPAFAPWTVYRLKEKK